MLQINMLKKVIFFVAAISLVYACTKSEPFDQPQEEDFENRYCNDPIAINYNLSFPGTVDNSTCIFPTDVFSGSYNLVDSVFNLDFELQTVENYTVSFNRLSQTQFTFKGFCPNGDEASFTADRYYKASADSTILVDSTLLPGQTFCTLTDTLSGTIKKILGDTDKIRINFVISSDTGLNYHIGTGIKQ